MSSVTVRSFLVLAVVVAGNAVAQAPWTRPNPAVKQIVDAISEERIAATMKKLESFGTRHILSEQDNPTHGIGAAQRWIVEEFKSYSPRLEVACDNFTVKKGPRIARDAELCNVIALLPGTINKDRYVLVAGHYDSIALRRRPGWTGGEGDGSTPFPPSEVLPDAPGVVDDASGTAAVLELARVMSQHEFDKTIVFAAFSAEEVGLQGSRAYATKAKEQKMAIEAVLNNDIIGSDVAGNGRSANGRLRVFSDGPEDSPARPVRTRRRSHVVYARGLRGRPAEHAERVLYESTYGDGYVRQRIGALHDAGSEDERRGADQPGAGAEAAGGGAGGDLGSAQRQRAAHARSRQDRL